MKQWYALYVLQVSYDTSYVHVIILWNYDSGDDDNENDVDDDGDGMMIWYGMMMMI